MTTKIRITQVIGLEEKLDKIEKEIIRLKEKYSRHSYKNDNKEDKSIISPKAIKFLKKCLKNRGD